MDANQIARTVVVSTVAIATTMATSAALQKSFMPMQDIKDFNESEVPSKEKLVAALKIIGIGVGIALVSNFVGAAIARSVDETFWGVTDEVIQIEANVE